MKFREIITVFVLSLLAMLLITPLGGYGGHQIKFGVALIIFCLLTLFFLGKYRNFSGRQWVIWMLLLSASMNLVIPIIYELYHGMGILHFFKETRMSWPSTLAYFVGIFFGYIIFRSNTYFKIIFSLLLIGMAVFMYFPGYELWMNKINVDTFTGKVDEECPELTFLQGGDTLTNADFSGKLLVLDLWTTSCGYCFSEMPEFESLYQEQKHNRNLVFHSVNHPLKTDSAGYALNLYKQTAGTAIPLISVANTTGRLKVNRFPTYLIIENGNRIIFRGSLPLLKHFLRQYN
jgi:thiol-disulfide isomerase/thioredoxin